MNQDLMFSTKKNTWCTPRDFFNKLNSEFKFTLDPCCTKKTALCKKYFTPSEDGLKQNWTGERVFVNPPYGREIGKWVKKAYEESLKKDTLVVMLIPARTDTTYFHNYIFGRAKIRFIKGRLKFIDMDFSGEEKDRKLSPAPFPSCIVIFNKGGRLF